MMANWTFLTSCARALLLIAHDLQVRLRDIAASLDITERSAFGGVTDLAVAGVASLPAPYQAKVPRARTRVWPTQWATARWHLVRSRVRRCRSAGPGSPRRCVRARRVLAAGGVPGRGSGCGGPSSL
jgi:hypothetical protein